MLKSPLFGFDDEDLFEIAWQRQGPLRAALRAKAGDEPRFAEAAGKLDRYRRMGAARDAVRLLRATARRRSGGRKRFLARLGHEADDALDEFLNLALDYERRETPSLQGFIAWLRAAKTDVKRDMEITRNEVRVMTVHGAKGLEAPIVILADTTTPPAGPPQRQPRLLTHAGGGAPPGRRDASSGPAPRRPTSRRSTAARERARREAEDEYRRLLYVAMTRAIDRLIVCGAEGERSRPRGCWWDLVFAALAAGSASRSRPTRRRQGLALSQGAAGRRGRRCRCGDCASPRPRPQLPAWLEREAPDEPPASCRSRPSSAYDEATVLRAGPPGDRAEREKARGPRRARAPAAAVAARHSAGSARRGRAAASRRAPASLSAPRNARR